MEAMQKKNMTKVKVVLDIKEEFLNPFLDELKHFDGKHYEISKLEVN